MDLATINQSIIRHYNSTDQVDPITKITDQLYLGQGRTTGHGDLLSQIGITHILSVGRTPHPSIGEWPFIRLELIGVMDHNDYDIASHFPKAFAFLREAIRTGGKVMVHCEMSISRAPTVMTAFLRANGYFNSLQEAFDYVKHQRPWVNPNQGFCRQLREFFYEQIRI